MIYRRARPEDKKDVIAVLAASYGGWHGSDNEAFWSWKFERNPHGNARIYVGDDRGRIAGCYILNPVRLRAGAAISRGAQAVDAAVSSDYRGQGVFTELARMALEESADDGIGPIFAFPSAGAFGGQIRVGFEPRMVVPKAYRPAVWPSRRPRSASLTLGKVLAFDARFDAFPNRGTASEIKVQRDSEYLQWRYFDHPTQRYETLTCERDGELCGYCVLAVNATGTRFSPGYVVDLQVLPESESAAVFLAYHSLRRLRSLGARVAVSWERPSGREQEALRSIGFSPRYVSMRRCLLRPDYVDHLIVFNGPEQLLHDSQRNLPWSLVPGDADYV
jgi:ribosomal protein S18 acetylase RimI-like enzyme